MFSLSCFSHWYRVTAKYLSRCRSCFVWKRRYVQPLLLPSPTNLYQRHLLKDRCYKDIKKGVDGPRASCGSREQRNANYSGTKHLEDKRTFFVVNKPHQLFSPGHNFNQHVDNFRVELGVREVLAETGDHERLHVQPPAGDRHLWQLFWHHREETSSHLCHHLTHRLRRRLQVWSPHLRVYFFHKTASREIFFCISL